MGNAVTRFLVNVADDQNHTVFDHVCGDICLNDDMPIKQSSGAVYGILVESKTPITGINPLTGSNLYPVYWGKDISPISRIKAHVQNHQGTGNANLRTIPELEDNRVIYGAIFVSRYVEFEHYLHTEFPPLRGTNQAGRTSLIITIIN